MKKIKYILFSILTVLISCSTNTEDRKIWQIESFSRLNARIDSSQMINDRYPLEIENFRGNKIIFNQNGLLEITEPESLIRIGVNSRCQNIKKAMIYAISMDENAFELHRDSLNINQTRWKENTLYIQPGENAKLLHLRMEIEGNPATYYGGDSLLYYEMNKAAEQHFWYDTVVVTAGNKSLYPVAPTPIRMGERLNKKAVIDLSGNDLSKISSIFDGKKVIGLGETIHGSREIQEMAIALIKDRIVNGNCKLVLLELPIDLMLESDLYVTGMLPQEDIGDIVLKHNVLFSFPEESIYRDFLLWLRDYNTQHDENVHLLGMDVMRLIFFGRLNAIGDVINAVMDSANYRDFYSLVGNCYNNGSIITEDSLIEKEPELRKNIGDTYTDLLLYVNALSFHESPETKDPDLSLGPLLGGIDAVYSILIRDSGMWQNTSFLLDLFLKEDETAVIYAHNGHLNKIKRPADYKEPLGYYLDKKYGDQYTAIAITAGTGSRTGSISGSDNAGFLADTLRLPAENSMEYLCHKTGIKRFCYPAAAIPDNIRYIRFMGSGGDSIKTKLIPQFVYQIIKRSNDHIIYTDKSTPAESWAFKNGTEKIMDVIGRLQYKRDSAYVNKIRQWIPDYRFETWEE
ncbi:MAG: erythromycin esterase family protein, partial [Tannerella sp.]|nr:erythromycin esterase family protein [Tannerella sp.]